MDTSTVPVVPAKAPVPERLLSVSSKSSGSLPSDYDEGSICTTRKGANARRDENVPDRSILLLERVTR